MTKWQTAGQGTGTEVSVAPRYPDYLMPIAGSSQANVEERYQRFCELREELLADYRYSTARAYWGDLQDWFDWATGRGKDVLQLSEKDIKQYCALLRRRKYSENTIRRRTIALRLLGRSVSRHSTQD